MSTKNIKKILFKKAEDNFVADIENIENRISNKLDKSDVVQVVGTSTTQVMSQKSVTDALQQKLNNSDAVHITGNESISGIKTFTSTTKMNDVSVSGAIFQATNDSRLTLMNGTNNTGAYAVLSGADNATIPGYFVIGARTDSGANIQLVGRPDGILSWNNKEISSSLVPTGTVLASAGNKVPAGFLLCNGATVSRTTFSNLFEAIGTAFGVGDGSSTFTLPDLRDRVIQGASATHALAQYIEAGLPNITGVLCGLYGDQTPIVTEAFSVSSLPDVNVLGGNDEYQDKVPVIQFNASGSNAIYGKSSTVQPPALALNYIIKI